MKSIPEGRAFHKWARREDQFRARESRVFLAGWWAGLSAGLLMAAAAVVLCLMLHKG